MTTHTRLVPALALSLALAACGGASKPTLNEFAAAKCGFSVKMPGAPKEETRTAQAVDGPLVITLYMATTADSAYVASCNDLPGAQLAPADLERMLDSIGQGAMTNIGATMEGQTAIALDGHPGREVTGRTSVNGQDAVVRARVFLVGDRMIQALVLGAKGRISDADMAAYLESLTLTK